MAERKLISSVRQLPPGIKTKPGAIKVEERYRMGAPIHYLIDSKTGNPMPQEVQNIVVPDPLELVDVGSDDPSKEALYTVVPGVEHKYPHIAIMLVSYDCDGICRLCFRKNHVNTRSQILRDTRRAKEYLEAHEEITQVLITGGDPMTLKPSKLEEYVTLAAGIDHVKLIRVGTKKIVWDPEDILKKGYIDMLVQYNQEKTIDIIGHIIHPREISDYTRKVVEEFRKALMNVYIQAPLARGINADPNIIAQLETEVAIMGGIPYYIFQMRPAKGNAHFAVPLVEAYQIIQDAKSELNGIEQQFVFAASTEFGKMEFTTLTADEMYFKLRRAADERLRQRTVALPRNDSVTWPIQLIPAGRTLLDYIVDPPEVVRQTRLKRAM
jgi:KamA family protein